MKTKMYIYDIVIMQLLYRKLKHFNRSKIFIFEREDNYKQNKQDDDNMIKRRTLIGEEEGKVLKGAKGFLLIDFSLARFLLNCTSC
jgi:hypothetical protein